MPLTFKPSYPRPLYFLTLSYTPAPPYQNKSTGFVLKGVLLGSLFLLSIPVWAQAQRYSIAQRGVLLKEALVYFVEATDVALAYDPVLVEGQRVFCVVEDETVEEVLGCLLEGTGLDFYRRSSGTYVITIRTELPPQYGYLTGIVVDQETRAPLPDAHVFLLNEGFGTTTNRAGQFTFPPLLPGQYELHISHLSYHSWVDTLRVQAGQNVRTQATLQVEPILITPIIIDGWAAQATSVVLERELIDQGDPPVGTAGGAVSPLQSLQTLAGIRLNDARADVHVQGGEAGGHQVRLDGVPVFLPQQTIGLVGPFSALALKQITVHKAGFGAGQGSHLTGVLLAEQAVEGPGHFDVQVDPISVNARLHYTDTATPHPRLSLMAATRVGLWEVHRPGVLQDVFRQWSAPDAFLILAPLRRYQDIHAGFFSDVLQLEPAPNPTLTFSDLHAALRFRIGPLRTVHASVYQGRSRFTGDLVPQAAEILETDFNTTPVTASDGYEWTNRMAQIRYDAVLRGKTLVRAQLRGSTYRFRHPYRFIDDATFAITEAALQVQRASLTPADNSNWVRTGAIEIQLDHAPLAPSLPGRYRDCANR